MKQEPDKDAAPKPRKSNAIASAAHRIARAIDNAPIVDIKDPDDLNDDGVVIGYAAPMSKAEMAATLAGATEGLLGTMRDGDKGHRFIDFFGDDVLTAQVRAEMINLCAEMLADIPDDEDRAIRSSIVERERIENLKEWLDANRWSKAEEDRVAIGRELERCFQGMPADIVVRERPPRQGEQGIFIEQRIVRLAGKKSAPIQGRPSVSMTGEPLEYLDALRFCFDAKAWPMLLNTAQVEQGGQTDKHETWESNTEGRACPLDVEESKAEGVFDQFAWLRLLVRPYLEEQIAKVVEIEHHKRNAKPLAKGRGLVVRGHQWAKISKVSAGLSWAVGGMGARWEDLGIDGHQFGPTANIPVLKNLSQNALLPPSLPLIPAEYLNKPHQTMFPLDLSGDEESPPLAVEIANATRHSNVMTLLEGKLAFYIFAKAMSQYRSAEDDEPGLLTTTARELARMVNPDADLRSSHYQSVFKALAHLKTIQTPLPNGYTYEVFFAPNRTWAIQPNEFDEQIFVGVMPSFRKILANAGVMLGKSYGGTDLIDLTAIMGLKKSGTFRQYVRACASWNFWRIHNEGSMDRMPTISMEKWAALTNHMSPVAIDYRRGTSTKRNQGRVRMSEAVKEVLEGIADMEGRKMVVVKKASTKDGILIVPTEMHLEAYRRMRAGEAKWGAGQAE
jgi:hypothetical protein